MWLCLCLCVCVQAWGFISRCVPVRQESVSGVRWWCLWLSLWSSHLWQLQSILQEGCCRWGMLTHTNTRKCTHSQLPADLIPYTHLLTHAGRAQWPDITRASYLLSVHTHISLLWVEAEALLNSLLSSPGSLVFLQVSRTTCVPAGTTAPSTSWGGKTVPRVA